MSASLQHTRRFLFFFFNDTATTEIYTLSLHDALPICEGQTRKQGQQSNQEYGHGSEHRSEEHTPELQSPCNLVCRLLLEKKKFRFHETYGHWANFALTAIDPKLSMPGSLVDPSRHRNHAIRPVRASFFF